jgi:hypothetical protein
VVGAVLALGLVSVACSDGDGAAPDPVADPDLGLATSVDEDPEPEEEYPLPDQDLDGEAESGQVVFHGTVGSRHLQVVGTAGGQVVEVAVEGYEGIGAPAVAPDGGTVAALAWAPGAVELATTLLVGTLGGGLEPLLDDPDLDMWCVRWYPSGDRLLLTAFVEDEMSPALVAVDLDGTTTTLEVPGGRFDCAVPLDDDRVALSYLGMDIALMGLALVDTSTGEAEVLLERPGCLLYGGALSPSGDELAVAAACEEPDDSGLLVVDLDSGEVRHLLVAELGFPAWSPSGEWLTIGVFETPSATSTTIWIVRRDGTGARQLSGVPGTQPAWVR